MSFARCISSAAASTSVLSLTASLKSMSVSSSCRAVSGPSCRLVARSSFLGSMPEASRVVDLLPQSSARSRASPPAAPQLAVVAKVGYKQKTHKASAKRFRVTGSGRVVRRKAWRAHLLSKKSTKRKNRLAGMTEVFRGDLDKIIGALPYLKVNRNRLPASSVVFEEVEVEIGGEEEEA